MSKCVKRLLKPSPLPWAHLSLEGGDHSPWSMICLMGKKIVEGRRNHKPIAPANPNQRYRSLFFVLHSLVYSLSFVFVEILLTNNNGSWVSGQGVYPIIACLFDVLWLFIFRLRTYKQVAQRAHFQKSEFWSQGLPSPPPRENLLKSARIEGATVDDAEPGTDIYRFHGDEFSYALGKDGAHPARPLPMAPWVHSGGSSGCNAGAIFVLFGPHWCFFQAYPKPTACIFIRSHEIVDCWRNAFYYYISVQRFDR